MQNFLIHIKGLVQGVGFRPLVCQLAKEMNLNGWICNGQEGVQIEVNASQAEAENFLQRIISNAPKNAIITNSFIEETKQTKLKDFEILSSHSAEAPNLLLPPDYALCSNCKKEIQEAGNQRHLYPFTTCVDCGPRYSIIHQLPYDRVHTTMKNIVMCASCEAEYNNVNNRRHYSQTNSCPNCSIPMHLFNSSNTCVAHENETILNRIVDELKNGSIVAVKNTGGYLLLCDGTNATAIQNLRFKKRRPSKPLALMCTDAAMAKTFLNIRPFEENELNKVSAPIVLCKIKNILDEVLPYKLIAANLDKLGVMLPSAALLYILSSAFGKPLIATSANISGTPIIYRDVDALENLFEVASLVLTYDREILTPQDDSVVQYTALGQKIILRRSRGLAPNYFPNTLNAGNENIFASGGELKSVFAFTNQQHLYISQFLGDQSHLESQEAYTQTFRNFHKIFKANPKKVLIDAHPNYFVSIAGREIAKYLSVPIVTVQHHKAHFAAVLAENELFTTSASVLGFIWDGTGYGEDGQIWGSELMLFKDNAISHQAQLSYFPVLVGDKMSKEPRLSALSLLKSIGQEVLVKKHFTTQEWNYYEQLLNNTDLIQTSSMGRFLDGIVCLLGLSNKTSYESEGVMKLEAIARQAYPHKAYYSFEIEGSIINWSPFVEELLMDLSILKEIDFIARKVMNSLVELIFQLSDVYKINSLAFSGGVFQNALLIDLLIENAGQYKKLYFHQQLSPNDENIALGQIAYYLNDLKKVAKQLNKEDQNKKILTTQ